MSPTSLSEDRRANDFARSQVPGSATYSGWHIALIIIGGTIALPAFLMATRIGAGLGVRSAIIAFASGCLILGFLVALTSCCGQKSGLSSYMLCEFTFGSWGSKLANSVVAISLIGWFGVTSTMFARASDRIAQSVFELHWPLEAYLIFGSVLIVGVTVSGFRGIDKLALVLVPVMAVFLTIAAWSTGRQVDDWSSLGGNDSLTLTTAISMVIGSYIAGVSIQPDYSRFARSRRAALGAAFAALGISFPIILLLTAIPAMVLQESDILQVMILLGIGVPAFLLLVLAAWSSNVLSLYSASLSLSTMVQQLSLQKITLLCGVFGTALGLLRVDEYLIDYLVLLGITVPPIPIIYTIDVLFFRSRFNEEEFLDRPKFPPRPCLPGYWR